MIRVRPESELDSHVGAAATAACTAASTSSASASGTWLITTPVAELVTSPKRPECELSLRPWIQ